MFFQSRKGQQFHVYIETFTGSYRQNILSEADRISPGGEKNAISFFTILLQRESVWEIFLPGKAPHYSVCCKHTWKRVIWIGILEGSLRTFFTSYISLSLFFFFRRPIWLHSWHYYHNQGTPPGTDLYKIIKTTNLTTIADL